MSSNLTEVAVGTARGGYLLFVGDVVSTAALTVCSLLIARFLGPSDYGLYSLTLIFPILLISVSRLGIEEAMVRFPAKLRAEGKTDTAYRVILSATKLRLLTGLVLSVITFLLSDPIA
ncbi:MAG: oligosaccharide flippase family protein, partial [Thermoplasmata archaeon]|nr:oligosaccharide flippase family protein [Thermoplasmata archaeon]